MTSKGCLQSSKLSLKRVKALTQLKSKNKVIQVCGLSWLIPTTGGQLGLLLVFAGRIHYRESMSLTSILLGYLLILIVNLVGKVSRRSRVMLYSVPSSGSHASSHHFLLTSTCVQESLEVYSRWAFSSCWPESSLLWKWTTSFSIASWSHFAFVLSQLAHTLGFTSVKSVTKRANHLAWSGPKESYSPSP